MATSKEAAFAGYNLLQLEAGLSTSSLATSSTSESTSTSYTGDISSLQAAFGPPADILQVSQPQGEASAVGMVSAAPQNFGLVVPGVYRSSFPQPQDFTFLQGLKLRTIVTLVQKELPEGFQVFMDGNGIRHVVFDMTGTKRADIPLAMMQSIIRLIADKTNHPMLIHCNQGRHRTGCVVGVLRRYHGWGTASALDEYERFAHPKVRPTDVHYLREFQLANLGHVVARRLEHQEQTLSIGQFVFFYIIVVVALLIWILTLYGVISFPSFDQPWRPKVNEI